MNYMDELYEREERRREEWDSIPRDEDGFIRLQFRTPRVSTQGTVNKTASKKKKSDKPFKKGSWKRKLYDYVTDHKFLQSAIELFHLTKHENIVFLTSEKDMKTRTFSTRITDKKLTKLAKKYPDGFILINNMNHQYTRLGFDSYRKLAKVQSIGIEYEVLVLEDGSDEYEKVYDFRKQITSINELCRELQYYRNLLDGIIDIQCYACWYSMFKLEFKILVLDQNGDTHTYKDINKFLEDYKIYPLL